MRNWTTTPSPATRLNEAECSRLTLHSSFPLSSPGVRWTQKESEIPLLIRQQNDSVGQPPTSPSPAELNGEAELIPHSEARQGKVHAPLCQVRCQHSPGVAKHPPQPPARRLYQFSSLLLPVWGQWGPARNWTHTYPASPHIMPQQGDHLLEIEMEYHPRSHNIICKMSRIWFFFNHSLYQEPEKSLCEWLIMINKCQHQHYSNIGIIQKEFWGSYHKNAQQAITNNLGSN